ncbi:MAG TPA: MamK family actin-like protein [Rhodocyclaceae bacterium]|nr:MamK family actin-like protein [Rhodocyclaceae bacterium]
MKTKTSSRSVSDKLYIGIDLGTSRSAIAASNGKRTWIDSYVGWPKDFVARKALGAPVLFGDEALKHRLSLELNRPLEHGVIKEGTARDQEAIRELIGHMVELVEPGDGQEIHAVVGVPAESFKTNKLAIKRCVGDAADAIMVVSEPFAVAYGKDLLDNALVIDIGAGTIDFCIMHGTVPGDDDQRTLLSAGDYLDRQLLDGLVERYPTASITLNMARQFKERLSFVGEPEGKVTADIPVNGKSTPHDITEEMRRACESILPGIVETAAEMIARFDPEYQDAVRRNIILAGGGSQIRGLARYLERELGSYGPCKVKSVDDPLFAGADGCLALAKDMPPEYWENPSD